MTLEVLTCWLSIPFVVFEFMSCFLAYCFSYCLSENCIGMSFGRDPFLPSLG